MMSIRTIGIAMKARTMVMMSLISLMSQMARKN